MGGTLTALRGREVASVTIFPEDLAGTLLRLIGKIAPNGIASDLLSARPGRALSAGELLMAVSQAVTTARR